MAKIDEIKEKISLYKFFLGIITGIILSIIGYTFSNYQHLKNIFNNFLNNFAISFYTTNIYNHKKYRKIKGFIMKEILIDIVGILFLMFIIELLITIKKLSKINDK